MTYAESIEFLTSLIDYERWVYRNYDFKLDDYFRFLNEIGNPQNRLNRVILVAGTKGKGSTAAMISALLQAHGHKVGLYTSPHIMDYRERIKVDGKMVSGRRFAELVERLKPAIEEHQPKITFFEAITTIGFHYFLDAGTTVNVLEVGLGGRLDATNVTNPDVSVITRIGHDHTQTLGNTLEKIAEEKCGILREKGKAVIGNQHFRARDAIREEVEKKNVQTVWWGKDYSARVTEETVDKLSFHYRGLDVNDDFKLPLVGAHQIDNAATALATVEFVQDKLDTDRIFNTLARINLPSRIQIIRNNPTIVVDMSHNQESALTLAKTLDKHFRNNRRRVLVIGITRHKNVSRILKALAGFFTEIHVTSADIPRAIPVENLYRICTRIHPQCRRAVSVKTALLEIMPELKREDILVVTGSVYVASEALGILNP